MASPASSPEALAAGSYQVKPGDTLVRIALEHGQSWRDLARWNAIENPNLIEVGQVLRVVPPTGDGAVQTRPVAAAGRVESRPLGTAGQAPAASQGVAAPPSAPASAPSPSVGSAAPSDASQKEALEGIEWAWPSAGPLLAGFDESKGIKGLSLGGKPGDPVTAAADGRVIYAGSGLRGYGNLVIVRHNGNFLSAYAHNQSLLVKEDQTVRKGQRIAEMGATDAERVKLHFEIRRKGLPVDPARFLPAR